MNSFVLAFPLTVAQDEPFAVTPNVVVEKDTASLMVPGCTLTFKVIRKEAVPGLSDIFKEHEEISSDDAAAIDSHKSLLFLLGSLKSATDLTMVNTAILKVLSAGALGVYMQQSGAAWTAEGFREELGDAEFPMDPWMNYLEGSDVLYTLGLETFALPDLCISKSAEVQDPREVLSVVADSLFMEGVSSKSGTEVDCGECGIYALRQETKSPFAKDDPEYNRQGIMRLLKR
jgi:hypothetical protein